MTAQPMRRARKPINQINVVPYIDVMLVLLVIFMVTAPLINPGEIELPSVGSKLTAPVQPLEVTLAHRQHDAGSRDSRSANRRRRACTRDELVARVRAKQAKPGQPVVIAADKSARYEDVIGDARPPAAQRREEGRPARASAGKLMRENAASSAAPPPRQPARTTGNGRRWRSRSRSTSAFIAVLMFSLRWQNRSPSP